MPEETVFVEMEASISPLIYVAGSEQLHGTQVLSSKRAHSRMRANHVRG